MNYRLLESSDFNKGFLELLSQLTTIGDISKDMFLNKLKNISKNSLHKIFVLEKDNKIISCATLLIEDKFIHSCGRVAHIEDVVVHSGYRGMQLGKKIINFLSEEAEKMGCYKILLDCSEKNIKFYEKCLYEHKGAYMAKYLTSPMIGCKLPIDSIFANVVDFIKSNKEIIILSVGLTFGFYLGYKYHSLSQE